jgi:wyosine [tRNA(Phe)-imidazoG37] synthetase (radical SAM superfamily)
MKYLFGPVNSRRLGVSLGIDLLPYKTCSFDCIYCECGCSTELTIEQREFFPTKDVIEELDNYLSNKPELDYITFSGSGEPTLHSGIGQIVNHLKDRYPQYMIALLTNGTLLGNPDVRRDIIRCDLVIPSIDAATEYSFRKICRPADGINLEGVIRGIRKFREEYSGQLFLEIFIIPGVNDIQAELEALKKVCTGIKPDAIQLNYLDRPGCVEWITVPSTQRLLEIKEFMKPLYVQIADRCNIGERVPLASLDPVRGIRSFLALRPASIDDIITSIGMRKGDISKLLRRMESEGIIARVKSEKGEFYSLVNTRSGL